MDAKSIVKLAEDAGLAILEIYNRAEGFEITNKSDNSPLTEADIAAHNIIVEGLQSLNNIPIVSEEGNVGDPLSSFS